MNVVGKKLELGFQNIRFQNIWRIVNMAKSRDGTEFIDFATNKNEYSDAGKQLIADNIKKKKKPSTDLQKAAQQRNWDMMRMKGNITQLKNMTMTYSGMQIYNCKTIEMMIAQIEGTLKQAIEKRFQAKKLTIAAKLEKK